VKQIEALPDSMIPVSRRSPKVLGSVESHLVLKIIDMVKNVIKPDTRQLLELLIHMVSA